MVIDRVAFPSIGCVRAPAIRRAARITVRAPRTRQVHAGLRKIRGSSSSLSTPPFDRRTRLPTSLRRTRGRHRGARSDRAAGGWIHRARLSRRAGIEADFFIDCSGFAGCSSRGAEDRLRTWTLPLDRAVAVPCESVARSRLHARDAAHSRMAMAITLQHALAGHVLCSHFMSDDEARHLPRIRRKARGARLLKFVTGRRRQSGTQLLALVRGGFLEPLESKSIHLSRAGSPARGEFSRSQFRSVVRRINRCTRGIDSGALLI